MTNTNLIELNIANLTKHSFEKLQTKKLTAVVIALGSNHQAEQHLTTIRNKLAKLGKMQLSTAFQNPDFTATAYQPKPNYINQCIYLTLTSPITLQQLQQLFRQFESVCNRQRSIELNAVKQVTMDIDILLLKLESISEWIVMAERYPFKAHERAGVIELMTNSL